MVTPAPLTPEIFPYKLCSEIEMLISMDHNNIVNIYEYYLYRDQVFMVMEYLEGGELLNVIQNNPELLSENNIRKIMSDILSAVAYMHSKNIGSFYATFGNLECTAI